MTPEERKKHIRFLHMRWKHDHPEYVKKENAHWWQVYKRYKPYKCVCARCGCKFDAPRPYYKMCGKCPPKYLLERKRIQMRKEARALIAQQAVEMYNTGKYSQSKVAEFFGVSQKQVSIWVNKARKQLTPKA